MVGLIGIQLAGQSSRKVSLLVDFHSNHTLYDRIIKNANGGGISLGMTINTNWRFKPLFELDYDFFLTTYVLVFENGKELVKKNRVPSFFIGSIYSIKDRFFIKGVVGPSIIKSDVYFSIKPSVGFIIDKKQRFSTQLSLVNVFERDAAGNEPFGYVNLAFIIRVF